MTNHDLEMMQANDRPEKVEETIMSDADQELCGNVVICIEKILEQLPQVNPESSIYLISKELHEVNDKAYAPRFISIGPFHHGTEGLLANEHYKRQGFINFLYRTNTDNKQQSMEEKQVKITTSLVKDFVNDCHCWVKEAWKCYAGPITMEKEKFVSMMLVDACFIVEFLLLFCSGTFKEDGKLFEIDFTFYQGAFYEILVDLIKLENQVPFSLLQNLLDLIPDDNFPNKKYDNMMDLTYEAFELFGLVGQLDDLYTKKPKHLVDFLSFCFMPSPDDGQGKQECENKNNNFLSFFGVLLQPCCFWNKKHYQKKNSEKGRWNPPSITMLCEVGVTIEAAEHYEQRLCLMNIKFKNGVLKIPRIYIESNFEVMIRNLIAFDHYPAGNKKRYAIQYVSFLNKLIETEQDAHFLVKVGVIINTFGYSDKFILEWFNNLCKYSFVPASSHFDKLANDLRVHCYKRRNRAKGYWNKAKGTLKRDYFNTPWAAISVIAATFLLILTLLQTIFSAISAFPS